MKSTLFAYTPFTGLGLYGGFRGNRWLRNRIQIFKQFVIPSLLNQTDRDFVHWISWRHEEKNNKYVKELHTWLSQIPNYKFVFTYSGVCFWDDKYKDEEARDRLFNSLHEALRDLLDYAPDCDEVAMWLVPSDDLYDKLTVESIKKAFKEDKTMQAVTYTKGYLCNYHTKEILEYNPKTNPPFFAIKFPREVFFDPGRHINYTGPYKSHEYVGDKLKLAKFDGRGFLVGTHGENISTHFNHPYGGAKIEGVDNLIVQSNFGIATTPNLSLPISIRKRILRVLPYRVQRKLRYLLGEKFIHRIYEWLRN